LAVGKVEKVILIHLKHTMKINSKLLTLLIMFTLSSTMGLMSQENIQRKQLFDFDWKFYLGDEPKASTINFDDKAWRTLDLPHDWSIEDIKDQSSPFKMDAISGESSGYTVGGIGWYRKELFISKKLKSNVFILRFDGVYCNSEIYLNGHLVRKQPHGYVSFYVDITDQIDFNGKNILAVKVSNEGKNSRWYSGSGIYRHVWLDVLHPVHVDNYGVSVTTKEARAAMATINFSTKLSNFVKTKKPVRIVSVVKTTQGKEVLRHESSIPLDGNSISFDMSIKSPKLWSVSSPTMYMLVTHVFVGNQLVDRVETGFGIRTLSFSATEGFLLNGESLKLKGGCVHHDNGPLGAKAFDRAEERKVQILKSNGYNAIRTSHNPPSPAFLDACDRLGMLVIVEAFDMWEKAKTPSDYHLSFKDWWKADLEAMVYRDRNHPSVIMWSIGNEIPEMDNPMVVAVAKRLADYARQLDPSRPVTAAIHTFKDIDPFMATLDVVGYNYAVHKYKTDHANNPKRVIFASESFPLKAFDHWMGVVDNRWVIGYFVWTAFDYIGEASIGWRGFPPEKVLYPWKLAYCGDIDICGWKRPQSFYRDALWGKNKLSIFVNAPQPSFEFNPNKADWSNWNWHDVLPDWNWTGMEGQIFKVNVYSSCEEVELFLNDISLGRKKTNRDSQFTALWDVPYQSGVLKAVGYEGGKEVNISYLKTADSAKSIRLVTDRTVLQKSGQDLCYVTVEVVDKNGILLPKASNKMEFHIEGPGKIIAVANSNPTSGESFQQMYRNAWNGKCLVIIQAGTTKGTIKLSVKSEGLGVSTLLVGVK
jgi:beta-galactosidase